MIRVFIGIMLMSIIPVFLSGDVLEDKYRNFMKASDENPSSKTIVNPPKKTITDQRHMAIKKESTASIENGEQQGVVDEFLSWIKGSSVDTEEDIKTKQNKINRLRSFGTILDKRIRRIDMKLTKKTSNQGLLRNLFNDTEEIDSLEEIKEDLVERRETVEKDIETLTEEIDELSK